MKIRDLSKERKIIALLIIMLIAVSAVDAYQVFATPALSTNTINEGGSGTQECSELVYKSGTQFDARGGAPWSTTPGGNDVQGTDAETVLSTALNNVVTNGGGTFCVEAGTYTLNSQWTQDFNGKTVRMKLYGATFVSNINDAIVFYDSCNGCTTLRIEGGLLEPSSGTQTNHAGLIVGEDASYNLKPFGTGTSIVDFSVIRNGGGYNYPLVFRTSQGDFRMVNDQFYARGGNASAIACLMGGPGTFAYIENEICQTAGGIGMELGNDWGYSIEGVPNATPFSDAQVKIDASNSNVGLNFSFANRDFVWADIESCTNGIYFTNQGSANTIYALITGITGSRIYGNLAELNYIFDKGSLPYGKITNFVGPGNAFTPWGSSATVVAATTYTVSGSAVNNFTSTGGTGVVLSIKDGQGNCLVCGAATVNGAYIPDGSTINFGGFSVAPTVKIYFSAG